LFEDLEEEVAAARCAKKRPAAKATTGDEVQVPSIETTVQVARHTVEWHVLGLLVCDE